MTALPPRFRSVPAAPLTGVAWVAARASLAARRTSRFAKYWSLVLGPLALVALAIPFASNDPGRADRSERDARVADTLKTGREVKRSVGQVANADSMLARGVVTLAALGDATVRRARGRAAAVSPAAGVAPLPSAGVAPDDPTLRSLQTAIAEARRLRTPAAWIALSEEPRISGGPRMRAVAESLAMLARERDELLPSEDREERAAPLTRTINRLGYTIVAIAENRYADFAAEAGILVDPAAVAAVAPPPVAGEVAPPSGSPPRPDAAAVPVAAPDTAALREQVRAARDTLTRARRAHAEATLALQRVEAVETGVATPSLIATSPAIGLVALLVIGLLVRFASALSNEMNAPTLAHARETERLVGAPVVATVRDAWLDGPARFRPGGVDPFRMLYLGLTSSGRRARTLIVTGDDPVIVAAVGARLAVSAAADHRSTFVADLDPANIALSRTFRERAEPGLTDALAGSFTWKEVARPVGSSDGLPITLLPAGTERDDLAQGEEFAKRRDELTTVRGTYDLTILVAPREHLALALALVESSPVVMSASAGVTSIANFAEDAAKVKQAVHRLYGTVLWDAPRPTLPSRAELAALLSKQKGRTPGGSFAAVQRAIGASQKDSNKPL